jgi:uncharacterized protein (UPF0332 family)
MTPIQNELLHKARQSLKAANLLLAEGFPGFAVSRAYYAMFYIVQTYLEGEGLTYTKHSAAISGFGQYFVKTGVVPKEYHQNLIHAFEARHEGDYSPHEILSFEEAGEIINHATQFVIFAEKYLSKQTRRRTENP